MDGNSFSILARVRKSMKTAGISNDEINQFIDEATAGDYDNLLLTVQKWVDVE